MVTACEPSVVLRLTSTLTDPKLVLNKKCECYQRAARTKFVEGFELDDGYFGTKDNSCGSTNEAKFSESAQELKEFLLSTMFIQWIRCKYNEIYVSKRTFKYQYVRTLWYVIQQGLTRQGDTYPEHCCQRAQPQH